MEKIIAKILGFIKIILFVGAFAFMLIGILFTYKRLEKSIIDALPILLPFVLILLLIIINLFIKNSNSHDQLLLNFVSSIVFIAIIIIGYRSKYDTNMLLYYKYQINFNPSYFSDNISSIQVMLYCLCGANVFNLLKAMIKDKTVMANNQKPNQSINSIPNIKVDNINNTNSIIIEEL